MHAVCTALAWHPVHETILASGGSEGAIMIWDVGYVQINGIPLFAGHGHIEASSGHVKPGRMERTIVGGRSGGLTRTTDGRG